MPGYWLNVLGNIMRTKKDLELEAKLRRVAQDRGVDYETVAKEYIQKVIQEYRAGIRDREGQVQEGGPEGDRRGRSGRTD